MSGDKDKAAQTADQTSETPEGEEDQPKGKGLGLIPMIIAAVVAAGVAGGAAFVLAPSGGGEDHTELAEGEHGDADAHAASDKSDAHGDEKGHGDDKKKKKKKADKGHGGGDEGDESTVKPVGEIKHYDYATFLVLEPIIISIQPIGRSKHLKVSLVLETDEDGAQTLLERGFYIQDVLNTYLRSVDAGVLEDPASMSRLRAQLLRRVKAIAPGAAVNNVLITEFVLT